MRTNTIAEWLSSHRKWILNNLAWSGIACFAGLIFALTAYFIPADIIQMAGELQALRAAQIYACSAKIILLLWATICFGMAAYAHIYWIGACISDTCKSKKTMKKNRP